MEVNIEVSNRHIHLTKETYYQLFDNEPTVKKYLSVETEYAANETVTIEANGYEIPNVRFLGPFREYNQVEISHNDAMKLKINPPVKASGDLDMATEIIVKTPKASIAIKSAIISERHIHINSEKAKKLGFTNGQIVHVSVPGVKSGVMDAHIKVNDANIFVMHIDTDDANAFIINNDNNKGTISL